MTRFRRSASTAVLAVALVSAPLAPPPATAAVTVWDPWNYAENVLSAARALEQINNQITSLQNEAEMLLNQAKNLASLPYSSLARLEQSIARTQELLGEAQRIAYDVGEIETAFETQYGTVASSTSDQALVEAARERWETSVAAFEDALKVQAGVVGNLDTTRAEMDALVTHSQGAEGALQAAQAGNQLLSVQARQLSDLTAVVAAQGRADALEAARQAAMQEQAREQLRRFLEPGAGYQPSDVKMFHE